MDSESASDQSTNDNEKKIAGEEAGASNNDGDPFQGEGGTYYTTTISGKSPGDFVSDHTIQVGFELPIQFSVSAYEELMQVFSVDEQEPPNNEKFERSIKNSLALGMFLKKHVQGKGRLLVEMNGKIQELDFVV